MYGLVDVYYSDHTTTSDVVWTGCRDLTSKQVVGILTTVLSRLSDLTDHFMESRRPYLYYVCISGWFRRSLINLHSKAVVIRKKRICTHCRISDDSSTWVRSILLYFVYQNIHTA
jgi:hypothetical protein